MASFLFFKSWSQFHSLTSSVPFPGSWSRVKVGRRCALCPLLRPVRTRENRQHLPSWLLPASSLSSSWLDEATFQVCCLRAPFLPALSEIDSPLQALNLQLTLSWPLTQHPLKPTPLGPMLQPSMESPSPWFIYLLPPAALEFVTIDRSHHLYVSWTWGGGPAPPFLAVSPWPLSQMCCHIGSTRRRIS